jgi:hypothetical protein
VHFRLLLKLFTVKRMKGDMSSVERDSNGECRIRYNNELYTLYKENNMVTYIKINGLRRAGHVIGLEEQSVARRVLVAVVGGRRQRGRPKVRWEDGVMEDGRKLGERNWRNAARNEDG